MTTIFLRDRATRLIHITVSGMRPFCERVIVSGHLVEVADYKRLCPDCVKVMRRLDWLAGVDTEEGDHAHVG
jgi:hypothetical protein